MKEITMRIGLRTGRGDCPGLTAVIRAADGGVDLVLDNLRAMGVESSGSRSPTLSRN
jgi:6-phosphofructokinase